MVADFWQSMNVNIYSFWLIKFKSKQNSNEIYNCLNCRQSLKFSTSSCMGKLFMIHLIKAHFFKQFVFIKTTRMPVIASRRERAKSKQVSSLFIQACRLIKWIAQLFSRELSWSFSDFFLCKYLQFCRANIFLLAHDHKVYYIVFTLRWWDNFFMQFFDRVF